MCSAQIQLQIHSCTDTRIQEQLQIQILFPAACDTLHNPPARAAATATSTQAEAERQWQRQQMRHVTHSAFYLCADLFSAAFFFFFYFSQLYSSLFLFCSFAVRRFSRFSRYSVAPVARFIYKFSKKRSTHPPRRSDFPIQFSKLRRVLRQRVRLGALSKENCVENRAPRFFFLKKAFFVRTLGVFWGRERERERVRLPCAPCTLCQSISLSLCFSTSSCLSLSLSMLLSQHSPSLSLSSLSQIYCAQIAQKSVRPGQ